MQEILVYSEGLSNHHDLNLFLKVIEDIIFLQGRFEILTLSGSFTITDCGGVKSWTGGLSVSLAGPDGRVIGGGIAGLLVAASPIQVRISLFCSLPCFLSFSSFQQIHLTAMDMSIVFLFRIWRHLSCGNKLFPS